LLIILEALAIFLFLGSIFVLLILIIDKLFLNLLCC